MLLVSLLLLTVCLVGLRLSFGPLEIPALASALATAASGQGVSVHMRRAALAWAGYHEGGGVPLFLRLGDIVVRNGAGVELAQIPRARLVVLPEALFGGKAPILVRASDAQFPGSAVAVSLRAAIHLGDGFALARADLDITLGAGRLGLGPNSVPITRGHFSLQVTPTALHLSGGRLALARVGSSAPEIGFSGNAQRSRDWQGSLEINADAVHAKNLAAYWPAGILAPTRRWVLKNITAGQADDGQFSLGLEAPRNLATLNLVRAGGSFTGRDLTLLWLPHATPITALDGRMVFLNLNEAVVTASAAKIGGLAIPAGRLDITGLSRRNQTGQLTLHIQGSVADTIAILNGPPLSLLRPAPAGVAQASGSVTGTVRATLPFDANLRLAQVNLQVAAALTDVALPVQPGLGFTQGSAKLTASGQALSLTGTARFAGEPARLTLHEDFKTSAESFSLASTLGPQLLDRFGLNATSALASPVVGNAPYEIVVKGDADGAQQARVTADLTPVALALPGFSWRKAAGSPGSFNAEFTLNKGSISALKDISARAAGLVITGQGQGNEVVFPAFDIGATRATGTLTPPGASSTDWRADFSGPMFDASFLTAPAKPGTPEPASHAPATGPGWRVHLAFQRVRLAASPAPTLDGFSFTGSGAGGSLRRADGSAAGLGFRLVPSGATRHRLRLRDSDAGTLLRALGAYNDLEGGTLTLEETYGGVEGASGTLELRDFRILHAPVFAKVMQGLTLYGVAEATSGPGLLFNRAIVPFTLAHGVLHLDGARAFSASLGFTTSGTIRLADDEADLDATIIPAYALNALPGKIPLLGHLFSAEKGGGLFAMRAKVTGSLADPVVSANPLSVITPGVLRDIFGLGGSAGDGLPRAK